MEVIDYGQLIEAHCRIRLEGQLNRMRMSKEELHILWKTFLEGGVSSYTAKATVFHDEQPELSQELRKIDHEWFGGKTDHVLAFGIFIWHALSVVSGSRPRASRELLIRLDKDEQAFADLLESESEYAAVNLLADRMRTMTEPILAAHITREFFQGSAGAKELNPINNQIAVRWLLISIRALASQGES